MTPRLLVATLCASLALVATACGGGGSGGEGLGSGADVAPASTAMFIAINTDFEGDQWQAAEELVRRFPDGDRALRSVLKELEEDEVEFEEIKAALGPEFDVLLLDVEDGENDDFIGLTQPRDEQKWRELAKKGDEPSVTEEIDDGWWAIADSQELLDRFKEAREGDSLADTDAFKDAMDRLEDEELGQIFFNGDALTEELARAPDVTPDERRAFECFAPGGKIPSFAFGARAEENGASFDGAYQAQGQEAESYEETLSGELPAGALAYVSFNNLADQIRRFLKCGGEADEEFDRQIAQAELALGVSIEEDVLPLFENEGALAVYRPAESQLAKNSQELGIPTVTLVANVDDERKAMETADKIAERASGFVDGVEVTETDIDGIAAKQVMFPGGQGGVFYAAFDGRLVVTSTEDGIRGLREEGTRLADDEAFTRARDAADIPDETVGFAYVNLKDAIEYAIGLGEGSGEQIPGEVRENLEPLGSLLFYGSRDGDTFTFKGFLGIE